MSIETTVINYTHNYCGVGVGMSLWWLMMTMFIHCMGWSCHVTVWTVASFCEMAKLMGPQCASLATGGSCSVLYFLDTCLLKIPYMVWPYKIRKKEIYYSWINNFYYMWILYINLRIINFLFSYFINILTLEDLNPATSYRYPLKYYLYLTGIKYIGLELMESISYQLNLMHYNTNLRFSFPLDTFG